jgi:hypothetical protein
MLTCETVRALYPGDRILNSSFIVKYPCIVIQIKVGFLVMQTVTFQSFFIFEFNTTFDSYIWKVKFTLGYEDLIAVTMKSSACWLLAGLTRRNWRWRQCVPLKRRFSTKLRGITSHKIVFFKDYAYPELFRTLLVANIHWLYILIHWIKLSLCLINQAPQHENVRGSKWRYRSTVLDSATRERSVVSLTARQLYSGERSPSTYCIGDWVGPRVCLDAVKKKNFSCLCWESNPSDTARSPLLYKLRYRNS